MMMAHARDSDWIPSPVPPGPPAIFKLYDRKKSKRVFFYDKDGE